jgi:hypothetical protein
MHSIKRTHIKSTRLAITFRELSEEFKNENKQGKLGKYIENLALTYKGISVGEIEDFFSQSNSTISSLNEQQILFDQNILQKFKDFFSNNNFENNVNNSSLISEKILYKIGRQIADWTEFSKKVYSIILLNLYVIIIKFYFFIRILILNKAVFTKKFHIKTSY